MLEVSFLGALGAVTGGEPESEGRSPITRLILRWAVGSVAGTLVIAVTSPLFVRSYLPLRVDPVRDTWTLPPQSDYRWRSEGYATTRVGPFGMPGKTTAPAKAPPGLRVCLWGDSQAEGVCLDDRRKLCAQAERLAGHEPPLSVFPLARSGEDADDWLTQIPRVESEWSIDAHAMLVVDLPDLLTAARAPLEPPAPSRTRAAFASFLPAFVIEAGRRVLTEPDGSTRRRLRFSLGPVAEPRAAETSPPPAFDWRAIMESIRRQTDKPVIILYAPPVPRVIGHRVITTAPFRDQWETMEAEAERVGITVIDLRRGLLESAEAGMFPHGYHNGRIGAGHLNADGYRVIAGALVGQLRRWAFARDAK